MGRVNPISAIAKGWLMILAVFLVALALWGVIVGVVLLVVS